jgi:hypothetical protein
MPPAASEKEVKYLSLRQGSLLNNTNVHKKTRPLLKGRALSLVVPPLLNRASRHNSTHAVKQIMYNRPPVNGEDFRSVSH